MLRLLTAALLACTVFVTPVRADPIFTPIAMLAFNAGLGVTVTNAILGIGALGMAFSAVGTLALAVGTSYISALLNRPQQQKPSDGQQELRQAVPARIMHYGRVKVSGPLAFYASREGALYKIVLLSSRQIDAIERIYLNDARQTIRASDGGVMSKPSYDDGGRSQGPNIYTQTRLGTEDQTRFSLIGNNMGQWTVNHRLLGQAAIAIQCRGVGADTFNKYYPNGEPAVSCLIRGALLYDPRDGGTRWSENAGLAVLDYLTHPDGYARPLAKIDLPSFAAYADLCDEPVPLLAGGTEPRYRIATSISLTESRKVVLARLLEACDAQLYPTSEGKIAIRGGRWDAPTVTIDDQEGHILEANFAPPDKMSRFNELSIQFLDANVDYVENECEPWLDVDDYAATGELVTVPLDLVQVPSLGQARRLAKIRMARDNCDWVGELVTTLAGLNAIGERVIRLRWSELDIDGPYWVEGVELLQSWGGVKLKLRSANPASYLWTPEEEGESTSIPPDTPPDYDLTAPSITLTQGDGPSIIATWVPSPSVSRTYDVHYRDDDDGEYLPMVVSDFRDSARSGTVSPGTYHVRIRVSAGPQAVGEWSDDYEIEIAGPPPEPEPEEPEEPEE